MSPEVLVVEDDDDSRELLCSGLRSRGYVATPFASAMDCLRHLSRTPALVIVTRVELPGMTGIELCRRIKRYRPEVGIIVFSSRGTRASVTAALAAGVVAFLPMPVHLERLLVLIEYALKRA